MRLLINHETRYRYEAPVQYSIQQLRLTPVNAPAQFVRRWDLDAPGKMDMAYDAYGNILHTLVLDRPRGEIRLRVQGEIETIELKDGQLLEGPGRLPLPHFTCATRVTESDEAVRALAFAAGNLDSGGALLALASQIADRVGYLSGTTDVKSTAAEALAQGSGVCQDHAHLMLACCRVRGMPARYVSGYLDPGDVPHAASHAWVDIWLQDSGWITIDVTHRRFASGQYCRVATGRDYEAAAPVRGMRIGGGKEELDVTVEVKGDLVQ